MLAACFASCDCRVYDKLTIPRGDRNARTDAYLACRRGVWHELSVDIKVVSAHPEVPAEFRLVSMESF